MHTRTLAFLHLSYFLFQTIPFFLSFTLNLLVYLFPL